ncbi:hypothetical protein MHYP_G00358660 [Metynnis hypsauchen]
MSGAISGQSQFRLLRPEQAERHLTTPASPAPHSTECLPKRVGPTRAREAKIIHKCRTVCGGHRGEATQMQLYWEVSVWETVSCCRVYGDSSAEL